MTLLPSLRHHGWLGWPERGMIDRFFNGFSVPYSSRVDSEWVPNFDISETDEAFIIRAEVPGMGKDDVDVTYTEGLLTIKGEKKIDEEKEDECYHCRESRYGSFSRSFRMPRDVVADKIDAAYKDGVLKLTVPKSEKEEPKKIEIKA